MYHGCLSVLVEIVRKGWVYVEDGDGIMPWGVDEFATHGAKFKIFNYLVSERKVQICPFGGARK